MMLGRPAWMAMLIGLVCCLPVLGQQAGGLTQVGFGSCLDQDRPAPALMAAAEARPDLFVMLGDNVYADAQTEDQLHTAYATLGAKEEYRRLLSSAPIQAIWDDHDYGRNDAGNDYPLKQASQQAFLNFFAVPYNSPRRQREGIYDAFIYGPVGQRVQLILLDTRYFRGPLRKLRSRPTFGGPYLPNNDEAVPLLGDAQWQWLEAQLRKPAELRIIATSIQFVSQEHGWECWGNFPAERRRMMQLIDQTGAGGVVFISGDRHHAEISRIDPRTSGVGYPLFDVTSSSLNRSRSRVNEPNARRAAGPWAQDNFGMIRIAWEGREPMVSFEIHDESGLVLGGQSIALSELHPHGWQRPAPAEQP